MDNERLAAIEAFQSALLEALHSGKTPTEMRSMIAAAAESAGLSDYVVGFDDRMLIVASELVRKWGSKLH